MQSIPHTPAGPPSSNMPEVYIPPTEEEKQLLVRLARGIKHGLITSREDYPEPLSFELEQWILALLKSMNTPGTNFDTIINRIANLNGREWLKPLIPLIDQPGGLLLSDVAAKEVTWVWKDRLALGQITTLEGDPTLGPFPIALDLAARVSANQPMPDGTPGIEGGGGVLLITNEEWIGGFIQPQLACAGANLNKIAVMGKVFDRKHGSRYIDIYNDQDIAEIGARIGQVQARLVVIYPLEILMGWMNEEGEEEAAADYTQELLDEVLSTIQEVMSQHQAACLVVRDIARAESTRAGKRKTGPAPIEMALIQLELMMKPKDLVHHVLGVNKNDLSRSYPKLTYQFTDNLGLNDASPSIQWDAPGSHGAHPQPIVNRDAVGRQNILRVLQEHYPEPISTQAIADALPDMSYSSIGVLLSRMLRAGQVSKVARGLYQSLPPA